MHHYESYTETFEMNQNPLTTSTDIELKKMAFSKKSQNKFPKNYNKCTRLIAYFVSRIAIVYNQADNT